MGDDPLTEIRGTLWGDNPSQRSEVHCGEIILSPRAGVHCGEIILVMCSFTYSPKVHRAICKFRLRNES